MDLDQAGGSEEMPSRGSSPGDPGEGHWAQEVYQRLKFHLQAQGGLTWHTIRNYLTDLAPFWNFLDMQDVRDLASVDRGLLRQYLYWLLTEARPLSGHPRLHSERRIAARSRQVGYATRSLARKLSALRILFGFLMRQGETPQDPTARVAPAKLEHRLPNFLDPEGVQALLKAPKRSTPAGLRDQAILELLYGGGLRVSEVVGLDVEDVNLDRGEVRVMGKGSRQRLALVGVPAQEALRNYLQKARIRLQGRRRSDAIFLNPSGGRLTQRSIQSLVRRYALQAGLPDGIHPHTLRHTFATHLLDGGADIRVVQELLGHTSPATTQIYTHVTQTGARRVYMSAHPRARRDADGKERTPGEQAI